MKSEPLLILVTCIEGMDEWGNVWGFDPKEIVAFIRKGTIVKVPSKQVPSLKEVNVQDQIENDDVWVINGRYVTHQGFQQWIQTIPWSNLGREVRIKVHRGGGRSIKDSDFQQTRRALGKFLEGAQDYSLGGQIDPNHPVVRFARYINNGNPNDNWSNYDNELAQLRRFFLVPHIRLSILKHRIAHLFLPIDIDLQGLMETGFREDYWKEVADAWKGGKALGTLTEARKWVYGDQCVGDSVQKVVEDAKSSTTDNKKRQEIETKWQQVQNILPQSGNLPNNEVNQILQDLGCQCGRDQVKQMCSGKSNPFHQWFAQLIEALDELRDAIEQAEGGGSRRE